jgi:hypothetical protein
LSAAGDIDPGRHAVYLLDEVERADNQRVGFRYCTNAEMARAEHEVSL